MPGPIRNVANFIGEAIVKPVVDEGAKMVEVGVQSVAQSSKPVDPQEDAKKKADEQRRLRNVNNFLQQMSQDQIRLAQLREAEKQKALQEAQQENQVKQEEKIEEKQKGDALTQAQLIAKRQTEAKHGVGG